MTIRGIVFLFLFFFFVEFLQAQQPVRPEKVCLFDQISARTNPERFAGLAVDGDGHLQDYMIISSATNDARLLLPNRDPVAFSTFNNQSQKNPCMTGFGLGSPMKDKKSLNAGYVFTFKPGYSTTWFQLRPLDFGDSNGVLANTTSMWLTGFYDGVFGGESNIIRRQPEAQRLKRKYDACDKFKQNQIEPLLIRAAPGKSFNEVRVNFNYVKGKEVLMGQTSDDEFALVDICYEILVPVCNKPKNPVCTCLASHLWEKRAALRVINRFSQTIHIHWVSDTGVEGRTLSIKANSSYTINTYITHAFRIRDNCGELLYELVVTKTREDVIVTGVFTKPNCDVLCGSRKPTPTPKKATPSRRIITTTPTPHPNATTKPMVIPMDPVAPIDCIPIGAPKPEILELVVAMRDLSKTHPDMEQAYRFERHIVEGLIGVDGKPVYNTTHKSITTTGQTNFNSWFNTIRGTNEEHNIAIPLRLLPGTNLYTFGSSDFFPLDNHLLGNEGDEHNYYWTMEWHTQFTYKGGETFKFTGNDDCWVYINGALVIDLGGVHGAMSREVDLDKLAPSLNLKKEYTYPFAFFFANRKKSTSDFHIQTSIVLKKDCVYIRRDKTAVNRLSSSTTKPTPPMTV